MANLGRLRAGLRVLALALVAGLAGAPAAQAAVPNLEFKGFPQLVLDRGFVSLMRDGGLHLTTGETYERRGRSVGLPVAGRQLPLRRPVRQTFELADELAFEGEDAVLRFPRMQLRIAGDTVTLLGRLGSARIPFAVATGPGRIRIDPQLTGLSASRLVMRLTPAGASLLDQAAGVDDAFLPGDRLGTLAFEMVRQVLIREGTTTIAYDPDLLAALDACGVAISPLDPATALAPAPDAPRGGVVLTAQGFFSSRLAGGTFEAPGGFRLERPGTDPRGAFSLDALNLIISPLDEATVTAVGQPTGISPDAPPPIARVVGATARTALTGSGGTVTVSGGRLPLTARGLARLAPSGCAVPAGTSLGTLSARLRVE